MSQKLRALISVQDITHPDKLVGLEKTAYDYVIKTHKGKNTDKGRLTRRVNTIYKFLIQTNQNAIDSSSLIVTPTNGDTGVTTVPIDSRQYILTGTPMYKIIRNEHLIFDAHLSSGVPLLLVGPKGTGKTLAIANWASKKKLCLIQYDCSEGTKEANLVGRFTMSKKNDTPYKLGVIPTIIECANQQGTAVLVLEEMNALTPAMQKQLNPLLDWRKGMFVEPVGKYYRLNKDAKLLIFATMNPSSYGASTNELNEDLMSRFAIWQWGYASTSDEKKILDTQGLDKNFIRNILNLAKESRAMHRKNEISYPISTRDLDLLVHQFKAYKNVKGIDALQTALEVIVLGKYDVEEEKAQMKSRIESIFGVTDDSKQFKAVPKTEEESV